MSDITIRGIPSHLVEHFWPFAEPFIKRALDHAAGEIEPNDLRRGCREQDCQLWMVTKQNRVIGAATTEIIVYPHKKHMRVITVAGSGADEWLPIIDAVFVDFASSKQCDAIEAHCRKGFVPKLSKLHYRHLHSVVVKRLEVIEQAEANYG